MNKTLARLSKGRLTEVKVHCLVQELVGGSGEIEKAAEAEVGGSGRKFPGERREGWVRQTKKQQVALPSRAEVKSVCFDEYRSSTI